MKKIINSREINRYHDLWSKKKTVLVGGCFDIFHYGHWFFLKKAKTRGDFLIVVLESDGFIENKKKKIPVHTQEQRAKILSALTIVDLVVKIPYFSCDRDYAELVRNVKPRVIAVTEGDNQINLKKRQAQEIGAEISVVSPFLKKFSGSKIIKYAPFFSD
ncbi:adenylyltransferase/cytidyltransferase family protein [Candidatus Roizmanbacteria bacterium]|nr:adenylyltransferase/cytidyltransferase family protein [Candidatus Roizmanbacteria bacterium]